MLVCSLIWNGDFSSTGTSTDSGNRGWAIQLEKPPIGNNLALGSIPNPKYPSVTCYQTSTKPCGTIDHNEIGTPFAPQSLYESQVEFKKTNTPF